MRRCSAKRGLYLRREYADSVLLYGSESLFGWWISYRREFSGVVMPSSTCKQILGMVQRQLRKYRCLYRHLVISTCRECVHFRGEPDPFKGDVPNERVRVLAKDTLEVLYDNNAAAHQQQQQPKLGGRIQGFGSSQVGHGGYSGSSRSRMMGFGGDSGPPNSAHGNGFSANSVLSGLADPIGTINQLWGSNQSAQVRLTGCYP